MPKTPEYLRTLQGHHQEVRKIKDDFTGRMLWDELQAYALVSLMSHLYKEGFSHIPMPSVLYDGGVGSGTSTQAKFWEKYFNYWQVSFGGILRTVSFVAIANGYTADEVIAAAQQSQLHLVMNINGAGGSRELEISSIVPDRQFSRKIVDGSVDAQIRATPISIFASGLNKNSAVEEKVVQMIAPYAVKKGGVVVEGRNTAVTLNRGLNEKEKIRAILLTVSEREAIRRSKFRLKAVAEKNGAKTPTFDEYKAEATNVAARNQRDKDNGKLITSESDDCRAYNLIINTDLAGSYTVFAAAVAMHGVVFDHLKRHGMSIEEVLKPAHTLEKGVLNTWKMIVSHGFSRSTENVLRRNIRDFAISLIASSVNQYSKSERFVYFPKTEK